MIDRRTISLSIDCHRSSSKANAKSSRQLFSPLEHVLEASVEGSRRVYIHTYIHTHICTHISTRSTLTPQGSVASSREVCMVWEMVSRSERISAKFLVPSTVRNVLAASSRVEWLEISRQFAFTQLREISRFDERP